LKNPVSQRKIKGFSLSDWQETRFLALVQDVSIGKLTVNFAVAAG
jgi:hypothetical protein